ncbi:MAG: hypothetical protein ACJAZS_000304 [Alteromonas naphthalenivorans]|jgi:hypothetical protein
MKKQIIVLSIILLGSQTTSHPAMMLMIAASKQGDKKPKVLAPGQTTEVKVKKGKKLVSADPSKVSVHKDKDGKTHVTAHGSGKTFLQEVESFFEGTKAGIKDNDKKKKEPKKHAIEVAQKTMPTSMKEGDKVHVVVQKGHKFTQNNKKDDDAGDVKIKHKKLDADHHVVRIHATYDGDHAVKIENKETGTVHNMKVYDND